MRMVRNLVMALAILASATAANAASFTWYETGNTNGNGAGGAGGAQGTALNLTCDTSGPAGSCSWTITARAAIGAPGLFGWGTDLATAPGNGVSASNPAISAGPFTAGTPQLNPGTPGTGAALLSGSGAFNTGGATPQTLALMTFTLTRSFVTGDLSSASIMAGPTSNTTYVWATFDGNLEDVGYAANAPVMALPGEFGNLPSIVIQNVPEPTSLSFLGLGVLALVRRRIGR